MTKFRQAIELIADLPLEAPPEVLDWLEWALDWALDGYTATARPGVFAFGSPHVPPPRRGPRR